MEEENEKYPQLILKPNGTYEILIDKGIELNFYNPECLKKYIEENDLKINGKY
ncbi:MAG: hypothetical protein LBM02_08030 [Lachnospiraceae bacterium]|jgi:hypothetical protein|nr:hypothetical protein [Lachnospiraceae bacterium]